MIFRLAAGTAVIVLSSCSSSTAGSGTMTTTTTTARATQATQPAASTTTAAAAPGNLHVGDTATLRDGRGTPFTVTVLRVGTVHAAKGDAFGGPTRGHRYIGVEYRITASAAGDVTDEGPWISTNVLDTQGHSYDAADVTGLREGAEMPGTPRVTAGNSVVGWIAYEVPVSAQIARVQYEAEGGLGSAAEWLTA